VFAFNVLIIDVNSSVENDLITKLGGGLTLTCSRYEVQVKTPSSLILLFALLLFLYCKLLMNNNY
jgi:hypothetical protein